MIVNFGLTRPANVGQPGGLPESYYLAEEARIAAGIPGGLPAISPQITPKLPPEVGYTPPLKTYPPASTPPVVVAEGMGPGTMIALGVGALVLIILGAKMMPKKKAPAIAGYRRHRAKKGSRR